MAGMKYFFTCFFFVNCFMLANMHASGQDNFDVRAVKNIQANRTARKTSFFKFFSGSAIPVSGGIPTLLYIKGMIGKNQNEKKKAIYIAQAAAITTVITFGMKEAFDRPRPAEHDPTIIALKDAQSGSFPSGHTSVAFSTATSLSIIHPKWYVIVPAYTWASLVGNSRMYLGVHYPTDIIAGAFIGSGSAWVSYKLNKWMNQPKKKTVAVIKF
jgi:membrane-associated phospholipid phosphatase